MARAFSLSGFPEWLPHERLMEQYILQELARVFTLHGFVEIETRSAEPLARLAGDADAAKEIYTLTRLQHPEKGADFGLHFDLTVPFARYVEENQQNLVFPFARFQIQKSWRGERPQEGRFREFYQADIDVVARQTLPVHYEAELAVVMGRALAALPLPPAQMRINNRELVQAFYRGLGIADVAAALRVVDKLPKIGATGVAAELSTLMVAPAAADYAIQLAEINGADFAAVSAQLLPLWEAVAADPQFAATATTAVADALNAALTRLGNVLKDINERLPGFAIADLSISRGLDYYTGTVYETFLVGYESWGSICSGGRYDSLVAKGGFPGVGLSIGVSRLVSLLLATKSVQLSRPTPVTVFVTVPTAADRPWANRVADVLRGRGIATEVSPSEAKFGKQIALADKRGIPYVMFPAAAGDTTDPATTLVEVKDLRTQTQAEVDINSWQPPATDLTVQVQRADK